MENGKNNNKIDKEQVMGVTKRLRLARARKRIAVRVEDGRYTRSGACYRLHVSPTTIVQYEKRGWLHRQQDGKLIVYDAKEVDSLASRLDYHTRKITRARDGQICARAFELFDKKASFGSIVIELKQPPARIRALYHDWLTSLEDGEAQRETSRRTTARRTQPSVSETENKTRQEEREKREREAETLLNQTPAYGPRGVRRLKLP